MAGHSLGEMTALAAAGRLAFDDALRLVEQRGYAFHDARLADPGKMISVAADLKQTQAYAADSGLELHLANLNSPHQTIVAGNSRQIDLFHNYLDQQEITNKVLYVSHAFHSPLIQPVAAEFHRGIQDIPFRVSDIQVMAGHLADYYPNDPDSLSKMPNLLRDQMLRPVRFVDAITRLHADGVHLFVEVGPGSILSNLARDTLTGKQATVLTTNHKNVDEVTGLLRLCGALFAEGVPLRPLPTQAPSRAPDTVQAPPPAAWPTEAHATDAQSAPLEASKPPSPDKPIVVYSGVAIGLPGSYKESFRDDNFDQLFVGQNLIERLTDEEKQRFVDLQITKLVKDESGASFKLLSSLDDVIQLAGKIGRLDLLRDYHLDEKDVRSMTSCIAHAVAAGYEALRDARIPLVQEYTRTVSGKLLPQRLALPEDMQRDTGIIFANGFPMIDPAIQEVSRHISYQYG